MGLNNFQSIVFTGINNVLNANYTTGGSLTNSTFPGSNFTRSGLNIQGVQTWNIKPRRNLRGQQRERPRPHHQLRGRCGLGQCHQRLMTLNFNDNSTPNSL